MPDQMTTTGRKRPRSSLPDTISNNPVTTLPSHPSQTKRQRIFAPLNIPTEVLNIIASYSDLPTLGAMMTVSQDVYNIAAPYLYDTITITTEKAAKIFMGTATTPRDFRKRRSHTSYRPTSCSRREVPLWPEVPIESDDESDDEPAWYEVSGPSQIVDYPSRESITRKLALFRHTRRLIVESIPSTSVSTDLAAIRTAGPLWDNQLVFPLTKIICFSQTASWQFADWYDRHLVRLHPFGIALRNWMRPAHSCITYPYVTEANIHAYNTARLGHRAGYIPESALKSRKELIRFRLKNFLESVIPRPPDYLPLVSKTRTFHNVRHVQYYFRNGSTRLFMTTCSCTGRHPSAGCLQHVDMQRRLQQMHEIADHRASERRTCNKWELPVADKEIEFIVPLADATHLEDVGSEWRKIDGETSRQTPNWSSNEFKMTTWDEAALCVCCGSKEGI